MNNNFFILPILFCFLLMSCPNPWSRDILMPLLPEKCDICIVTNNSVTCTTAGQETRVCSKYPMHEYTRIENALGHDHFESLICRRVGCNHQYAIGHSGPAGGIIIYVADGQGFTVYGYDEGTAVNGNAHLNFDGYTAHYLEAAPTNAVGGDAGGNATMRWSTQISSDYFPDVAETIEGIGYGRNNTALIIAAEKALYPSDTYIYAVLACDNYSIAEFNDWFLPSRDELNQLYLRRADFGLSSGWFWSSSQDGINRAWNQNFYFGGQSVDFGKYFAGNVHAVRAF